MHVLKLGTNIVHAHVGTPTPTDGRQKKKTIRKHVYFFATNRICTSVS